MVKALSVVQCHQTRTVHGRALVDFAELTIPARALSRWSAPPDLPVAFVDLARTDDDVGDLVLPPCPVIGIGPRTHPLAPMLDAVAESPVTPEVLARQILKAPLAAATFIDLLRVLPALSAEQGLVAESLAYATLQGSAEHLAWRAGQPAAETRPPGAVRVERSDDQLLVVLADPERGNAIDRTMRDGLSEAFQLAALDASIARIELRAEGRAFSLGAELGEFGTTVDPATAHAIRARTLPAHWLAPCSERLEVHVQGACIGSGLEMAAWGRRVTATAHAWFQLPELAMGIIPGAGGCVSLVRRIGRQRTALLGLSGKRIGARQALEWGLVDALVDEPA